jgi:hypothetical protein
VTGPETVSPSIAGHSLEPAWRLEGARAVSTRGDASIELARPQDGIALAEDRSVRNAGHIRLLGLSLGGDAFPRESATPSPGIAPSDTWTRGADLVAVYEPHDPRFLRATAMWRHSPGGSDGVLAWELVASAQTSLLESDAAIAAISMLPSREALVLDDGSGQWHPLDVSATARVSGTAVLARCDGDHSVLVTVHPADARRVIVGPAESSATKPHRASGMKYGEWLRIECWLFPNAVEKGVLLRGRSLAAIGPTEGDVAWAEPLLGRFRRSPPVLTT